MAVYPWNLSWTPLVLELINRGASATAFHETLENYVTVEIFSKLSAEQKRVLSVLSIFREPVSIDALSEQKLDIDVLDSLVEQGLARQVDSEVYDVHDLIREFLLRSLDEELKIDLHNKCSSWYQKFSSEPVFTIELIFHLVSSDNMAEAAEIIVKNGRSLISQGHMELLGLIDSLNSTELSDSVSTKVNHYKGEILALLGKFEDAKQAFLDAQETARVKVRMLILRLNYCLP